MNNRITVKDLFENIRERHGCFACTHLYTEGSFKDAVHMCLVDVRPRVLNISFGYAPCTDCENWSISISEFDDCLDEIDEDLECEGIKIIKEVVNANTTD